MSPVPTKIVLFDSAKHVKLEAGSLIPVSERVPQLDPLSHDGDDDESSKPHLLRNSYVHGRKRVIFSLYGDRDIDFVGAIFNAQTVPLYFLGWKALIVMDEKVPEKFIMECISAGAEVRVMKDVVNWGESRRIIRYLTLSDSDLQYAMFRDLDSRITAREISSVNSWLQTTKTLHIMRDHPYHNAAILGGLWGIHVPSFQQLIPDPKHSVEAFVSARSDNKYSDQGWLDDIVWPKCTMENALVHDTFLCDRYGPNTAPFPIQRDPSGQYVGEVVRYNWEEYRSRKDDKFNGQEAPLQCRLRQEFTLG